MAHFNKSWLRSVPRIKKNNRTRRKSYTNIYGVDCSCGCSCPAPKPLETRYWAGANENGDCEQTTTTNPISSYLLIGLS